MELTDYYKIADISRRRVRETKTQIKRFLYEKIDFRDRLISISGSRGVGKTTMILQYIKEAFKDDPDRALYVSLDNIWFEDHSLIELVDEHYKQGGSHIFIDEVHYQQNWQTVIKNIYDNYPGINIVYTGSSILKIDYKKGDLSRRMTEYFLPGLSFREYLKFENVIKMEAVSLKELLEDHERIAEEIAGKTRILKYFNSYLHKGYYPFYKEVYMGYEDRILQIINQILESDYPCVEDIKYSTVKKIKRMLYILSKSCPQTPNMSELYAQLETDRNQGLKMLGMLEKAKLLNLLSSEKASLKNMSRPDKIYCDNTNLMCALTDNTNAGTMRETFFLNQLISSGHKVTYPPAGDFLVDDRYLFEVGGKGKSFDQIKDISDSYLAIDDIESSRNNRIPLWMFGLLY